MMKKVKAMSFEEMVNETQKRFEKAKKEFEKNGGICLNCKKNPGDTTSTLNPMHCKDCNVKTEELLKQLRGPGFVEIGRIK